MEKNLLWEAITTLSPAELRDFGKFVQSPFFNSRQQPVVLYDYLFQCRRQNRLPDEKEAAHLLQYPEGGLKFRQSGSALLALLEHFLAYREKFADNDPAKINIAAAYRKRNLTKHFNIALREAKTDRERQPWRDADYFQDLNLIEWEQYQHDSVWKRTERLNLQATSDLMDLAFMARKLRLACLAISHQNVFKEDYEVGLMDAILDRVASKNLIELPAIGLYYHCYKFQTDAGQANRHFEYFRLQLAAQAESLPPGDVRTLYLLAINFGIKRINQSAEGWVQYTFELYRGALERAILLENGQISRFAFNNIIALALRIGELDWVEHFILDHKKLLERQWREATASMGLARVAYARKDFKTALLNLQRTDYKDQINNLTAKALQLKIFYESGAYELLESHLNGMKNYIRRHTRIGYHRTSYGQFVSFTRQLMSLNFKNKQAVETLRNRISAVESLIERDWLLDMLGK